MKIFITGASGYVGSVVTEKAVQKGHSVVGLARSEKSAEKIRKLGGEPLLGTLHDVELLAEAARSADAVLHLGFVHEFDKPYDQLVDIDIKAIQAMGKAIAGTNKPLVTTSGTAVLEADGGKEVSEDAPLRQGALSGRRRAEVATIDLAKDGVRSSVIRLSPYVFGRGGSYFVPMNIEAAAKFGFAPYVGDGTQMTSAADVDEAAELYLLAMEKAQPGAVFNCTTETDVSIKKLAEAIATALGIEAKSVSREKSVEMCGPFTAIFLQIENRAGNGKARSELGWNPAPKYNVCDDIVLGSYKPMVEGLKKNLKAVAK